MRRERKCMSLVWGVRGVGCGPVECLLAPEHSVCICVLAAKLLCLILCAWHEIQFCSDDSDDYRIHIRCMLYHNPSPFARLLPHAPWTCPTWQFESLRFHRNGRGLGPSSVQAVQIHIREGDRHISFHHHHAFPYSLSSFTCARVVAV